MSEGALVQQAVLAEAALTGVARPGVSPPLSSELPVSTDSQSFEEAKRIERASQSLNVERVGRGVLAVRLRQAPTT